MVECSKHAVSNVKLSGTYLDPALGRITLARFVDDHYYRATMVGLEPSTRVRDESYLRTHILPASATGHSPASDTATARPGPTS